MIESHFAEKGKPGRFRDLGKEAARISKQLLRCGEIRRGLIHCAVLDVAVVAQSGTIGFKLRRERRRGKELHAMPCRSYPTKRERWSRWGGGRCE